MRRGHKLSLSVQDSLPVGTIFDLDYTGLEIGHSGNGFARITVI